MRRCPQLLLSWTGSKHLRSYVSLQWHDRIGKFHAKSHLYFTTLLACQPNKAACQLVSPTISLPVPESMRLDFIHLTRAKRALRIAAVLCLYCAATDHFIQNCPVRPPRPAVSTLQLEPDISTLSLLSVQLLTPDHSVAISALVDSGSSGNFISQDLLSRLHLPRRHHA